MIDEYGIGPSRRTVLLGIGTVGAASTVVGLGTGDDRVVADEERLEDERLEAGELDLHVHYEFAVDRGGGTDDPDETTRGTVGGDVDGETNGASVGYDLADVAPGDRGSLEFRFSVVGSSAYLRLYGELGADDRAGTSGSAGRRLEERDADGPVEGRLADAVDASLHYCDGDGETGDEIAGGTLREVVSAIRSGVPLDGAGDGNASVDDRAAFDGGEDPREPTDETGVRLEWSIDEAVGNEVQSDAVAFDLSFSAGRVRRDGGVDGP